MEYSQLDCVPKLTSTDYFEQLKQAALSKALEKCRKAFQMFLVMFFNKGVKKPTGGN